MPSVTHTAASVEPVQCPVLSTLLVEGPDTILKPMPLPSTLNTEHWCAGGKKHVNIHARH